MGSAQGINDDWLSNYRKSITRALHGVFDEIDFLPEPFAVFQYYRYGVRHALVAQKRKHVALILDFGGGSFDASIIESTKAGDIAEGGRISRPLAASSEPVGGFYLDQKIAESLISTVLTKGIDRVRLRQAWSDFDNYRNYSDEQLREVAPDIRHFTRNIRRVVHVVERGKLAICQSVSDWALTADLSRATAYRVSVPTNPFAEHADWRDVRFDAALLRQVFEREVWDRKLKRAIGDSLRRATSELAGKEISIVLLSGGSANIRWMKLLIDKEFSKDLANATVVDLSENFQEIVAKGLAIECARRFYTDGRGDFKAVTYNRLCLVFRGTLGRRLFGCLRHGSQRDGSPTLGRRRRRKVFCSIRRAF